MTKRSARICVHPGCPNIVRTPGVSRCPLHQAEYERTHDARRPSASQRGYDSRWKAVRDKFLADHPFCEMCGAPAEIAHHVIRKRVGGVDEGANLVALCKQCHGQHHAATGESWKKQNVY